MHPYANGRRLDMPLRVTCGRCEGVFTVTLKRGKDHPLVICPKCKVENRLNIIWK
jgi:hypothetical protein